MFLANSNDRQRWDDSKWRGRSSNRTGITLLALRSVSFSVWRPPGLSDLVSIRTDFAIPRHKSRAPSARNRLRRLGQNLRVGQRGIRAKEQGYLILSNNQKTPINEISCDIFLPIYLPILWFDVLCSLLRAVSPLCVFFERNKCLLSYFTQWGAKD